MLIFFAEKKREAFALQQKEKKWHIPDISIWYFKEKVTNNVVSFK